VVRLDNQPWDRATVVDERRLEAVMADERGQRQRKRESRGGGREATKVEARVGLPGSRQEVTTILAVDERCVMNERRQWQQTRGEDLVARWLADE
jgi:hypothetical protein